MFLSTKQHLPSQPPIIVLPSGKKLPPDNNCEKVALIYFNINSIDA